jgi:FkbM family methyltransferase
MYSQNNEEEIIINYFNQNVNSNIGKFIEIGAYDPFRLSNTRKLYELGWSGVYVEPSPICFHRFKVVYNNDLRIHLINAAISDKDGVITLFESNGDAVSTTDIKHKEKWEKGSNVTFTPITVNTISMQRFINEFGSNVDFLSLDTEGTNYQLFSLIPDDFLHRLKMICIEHDSYNVQIMNKLSGFGFKQISLNPENLIAAK